MKEYSEHPFYIYQNGLNFLINMIGRENKYYFSALTLQQRLKENISFSELFGDTDTRKAERAEIVHSLNKLSMDVLNYSFNDLCEISNNDSVLIPIQLFNFQPSTPESLPLTAWPRFIKIANNYDNLLKQHSLLTQNGEYEEAKDLYWQILYFTGTREFWDDRIIISKEILKLSKKEKDYKSSGLILAKGDAYRLMSTGNLTRAKIILKKALEYFSKAKAYSESGVIYEYMADICEMTGQLDLALDYYKEAIKRLSGMEQYDVYLKKMFFETKNEDFKSRSRIVALTLLRDKFNSIKNYAEAMVEIELAKSLYVLKDQEALLIAQHAYNLLKNEILMPRNIYKAEKLLQTIKRGEPIITK